MQTKQQTIFIRAQKLYSVTTQERKSTKEEGTAT